MNFPLASAAAAISALLPAAALCQPTNHIGEPLAEILLRNGCEMDEGGIVGAMQSQGLGAGDYQAQVMALSRGGYIVAGSSGGRLKLAKWGACQ